jgi:hypothetical protein
MVIAFLVADHSSSDSSPSSLIAIGLGSIGVALVLLGSALLAAFSAGKLWRWVRRALHGGLGSRRTPLSAPRPVGGEGRSDGVARAQVRPVPGRVVIERQQVLGVPGDLRGS